MTPEALKEALELAQDLDQYSELAHNEPKLLVISRALLELNEAHEKLKEELEQAKDLLGVDKWDMQKNFETSQSMLAEAEKENERLLADNAVMRKACLDIYNKLPIPPVYPGNLEEFLYDIAEIAESVIKKHPGQKLLDRMEKMEIELVNLRTMVIREELERFQRELNQ